MTKSELIDAVAQKLDLTRGRAKAMVNTVFDAMTAALERGDGVELRGFASFSVRHYEAYTGRDPKRGNTVEVTAKRLPFFRMGKELKELVNRIPEDAVEAKSTSIFGVASSDTSSGAAGRKAQRESSSGSGRAAVQGHSMSQQTMSVGTKKGYAEASDVQGTGAGACSNSNSNSNVEATSGVVTASQAYPKNAT